MTTTQDRIAAFEDGIRRANAEYAQYHHVMPFVISSFGNVGRMDPTKAIRRYELAVEIDRLNVELEEANADAARERGLGVGDRAALVAADAAARAALVAARVAVRAAQVAVDESGGHMANHDERAREAAAAEQTATSAADRWRTELAKDERTLAGLRESGQRAARAVAV